MEPEDTTFRWVQYIQYPTLVSKEEFHLWFLTFCGTNLPCDLCLAPVRAPVWAPSPPLPPLLPPPLFLVPCPSLRPPPLLYLPVLLADVHPDLRPQLAS